MRTLLLAAVVTLGLAGAARADYWTVNTFVESVDYSSNETNITAGDLGAVTTLTLPNTLTNQVWTMTMNFSPVNSAGFTNDPSNDLDIRLGGVSGAAGSLTTFTVRLDSITWFGDGTAGSTSITPGTQLVSTNTANYFFSGFDGTDLGTVTSLVLSFTINASGGAGSGTFTMEAIANPEPGTFALFGLGAAGLGAAAWRRRRARRTKAAQVA